MIKVTYGVIVEGVKDDTALSLSEELDVIAKNESWSWVVWTLNDALYAIINSSLRMKGEITYLDHVEITSLGEALDSSEDSRSRWLIPRARATGSQQDAAQAKISNYIETMYGRKIADEDEQEAPKPVIPELSAIKKRNRKGFVRGGVKHSPSESGKPSEDAGTASYTPNKPQGGDVARKSRRG